MARLSPPEQLHPGKGDTKGLGQKSAQGRVGLTLHRRRLEPDPIVFPLGLYELVPASPGLNPQMELQVLPHPSVPAPGLRHKRQNGLPVSASRGGTSSICNKTSPIITAMGDRSIPPTGGISRWAGWSMGSVSRPSKATAGL